MASVVIVDEDRPFREALAIAARLDGHRVRTAGSAREAAGLLDEAGACLLVIDCLVPGADDLLARRRGPAVVAGRRRDLADRLAARHRLPTLEKPFGLEALPLADAG